MEAEIEDIRGSLRAIENAKNGNVEYIRKEFIIGCAIDIKEAAQRIINEASRSEY